MYHGDIRLGDTIDIKFTTRRFTTGAPFTLAGSPSVAAYAGNNTTEISAGITLTVDFDSRTGLNNINIVASSGNGYAAAINYTLVITAGTVDSVSVVGECVGSFSIENRSALMPLTAGQKLTVNATGEAEANVVKWNDTTPADLSGDKVQVDVETWKTGTPNALVSGRVDASAGAVAADAITASAIAADAIGSSELAATAANEIADAILSRNASNVEATAGEHTLCTVILAMLENSISGTTLTIKRTDGSTTHVTKTLSTDEAAQPITGIT